MQSQSVDTFIAKWSKSSGSEKGNHQSFVIELCDLLGVPRPDPVVKDGDNAYVFEKAVVLHDDAGAERDGWIDCYRRGSFVLEAKQSTASGPNRRGTPAHQARLLGARKQAEGYVRALDPAHEPVVPFLIVLDVGGSFDLFSDFTRTNRFWSAFPDAASNRIRLADLVDPAKRTLLARIWTEPYSLDPSAKAQVVTRNAAEHLAVIARELEAAGHTPERVAGFLMRYFFCAFAEDIGLMQPRQFTEFLIGFRGKATHLAPALDILWRDLNHGGFSQALRAEVLHFNGGLFAESYALPVTEAQLDLLIQTAEFDWSPVEPAIFGTLLERALDPRERHRLGAHYTPRAYVDRLVSATITEPLRATWQQVQDVIEDLLGDTVADQIKKNAARLIQELTGADKVSAKKTKKTQDQSEHAQLLAQRLVAAFHRHLAAVRILDPACGSGNFLYVALEHLKRLEGEVLGLEARLGAAGSRIAMAQLDVDPRNFLGLEINPRAARIAELVLWIGYLQWHRRTRSNADDKWPDPVLHAYKNITCRDALIEHGTVQPTGDTIWDGHTTRPHPVTGASVPDEKARTPVMTYDNVIPAEWPQADYIVGNPPFIGNKRMRQALGDGYVEAVRSAWGAVPETADFVMYWWHHAAQLVRANAVRRFGLITTNSITQTFNRQIVQGHLDGESMIPPLSLCGGVRPPLVIAWAIPDHPWVDAAEGASVRVAMTVGCRTEDLGPADGWLLTVAAEGETVGDVPAITYAERRGMINADLTIGAQVTRARNLKANNSMCFQGMNLVGEGFRLTNDAAAMFGSCSVIKPYQKGKELLQGGDSGLVIDCFGLTGEALRERFPAVYQHLSDHVRPEREQNKDRQRREKWWLHGRSNETLRDALLGLDRYICTVETSKHKPFVFVAGDVIPDHKLYAITTADAWILGVLSSRIHLIWADAAGGTLEDRPTWTNTTCFSPYPFPVCPAAQQARIRQLGEDLDAHRKRQQAAHPGLTLTGMYNVLAKLRSGEALTAKEKTIHEQGLCAVLKDIHDRLDAEVAAAYGWPADLPDDAVLDRLVQLNTKRATEEAAGTIRWLRPDYQRAVVKARR